MDDADFFARQTEASNALTNSEIVDCRLLRSELGTKGFYKIENAFTQHELNACEQRLTHLMFRESRSVKMFKKNMSAQPGESKSGQMEILRPSLLCNSLRSSAVFKRCHAIAATYFAHKAYYLFDHAIFKMPQSTTITHWHQDQAYLDAGITLPSLHFWIPFQDTTAINGAMQFASAVPTGLQHHEQAYPDNPRILKVVNPPTENVHTMEICHGDVSIHTNLTLHSATQNRSHGVRKAWIIHFGPCPNWYKHWLRIRNKTARIINAKHLQKIDG